MAKPRLYADIKKRIEQGGSFNYETVTPEERAALDELLSETRRRHGFDPSGAPQPPQPVDPPEAPEPV